MKRAVFALVLACAALAIGTTQWHRVFPYRDHIAPHVSARAAVYAHAHLTPRVRSALQDHLAVLVGGDDATLLAQIIGDPSVEEVGVELGTDSATIFLWGPTVGIAPIVPKDPVFIGQTPIIVRDLRGEVSRELGPPHVRPLNVVVRTPELFSVLGIQADGYGGIPETIALQGTITRDGVLLRTADLAQPFPRGRIITVSAPLTYGSLVASGVPLRMMPEPFSSFLATQQFVDVYANWREQSIAVRADTANITSDALSRAAAMIAPALRPALLDGFVTQVATADASAITVERDGTTMIAYDAQHAPVLALRADADGVLVSNRPELVTSSEQSLLRLPRSCSMRGSDAMTFQAMVHPQVVVLGMFYASLSEVSICGLIEPRNE
ncbi:MAG: hypothetical protein Q7S96_04815 [bacterium]|nr:hypothetical protein [bacterium]